MNLSPLSISSANTPYDRKNISPSIHQKNPNSTVKQFNNISQKNEIPKQDEPLKNFSNYFNNLQTQNRSNDRKTNVTEFKKEVKMIIKDAKKRKF